MNWTFKRCMAVFLTASLITMSTHQASAMLAPAQLPVQQQVQNDRAHDLKTVQMALEQKEVRTRLTKLGLSDQQIQLRLAQLTDSELHAVATQIDRENPAGDGSGFLVSVLVIGILVLLFVYLLKRV